MQDFIEGMEVTRSSVHDDEVRFLRKQGFVAGACGHLKDEFEEGLGDEPRGCEEDGFGFREIQLAEKRIECRLEEFFKSLCRAVR